MHERTQGKDFLALKHQGQGRAIQSPFLGHPGKCEPGPAAGRESSPMDIASAILMWCNNSHAVY